MKKGENNTSVAVAIIGARSQETTLLTEKDNGGYEEIHGMEEASNRYHIPQNIAYKLKFRKRKKR